jgi:DNA-binding IclR family transcriptional regulator
MKRAVTESTDVSHAPHGSGVAAVDRALVILASLQAQDAPCTLAALARLTGLYKSTLLRLLASLLGAGYVAQLPDGRYAIGPAAVRLNLAYERQNPLRQHVLPVLQDLVRHGTESASFHVRHDAGMRLCLLRVNSGHPTLDRVEAGDILPVRHGAAGRVLLAFGDGPAPHHQTLRTDGYALSTGERDPSCAGLAAPVFGPAGRLAGALSLSGPKERFTPETIARMRGLLLAAAGVLSLSLGSPAARRE